MNFPAFCECESILGRKSTDVMFCLVPFILHWCPFMSIHFLRFWIHFFCSFHFPFILHSCPFMFRRYVWNIQVFERWYVQTGQVGIRPNALVFFHMSLSFLLSFCYPFGGLCRLPSSGFMNMYMYKFVIVIFALAVFWAGSALVVLRGRRIWNARVY